MAYDPNRLRAEERYAIMTLDKLVPVFEVQAKRLEDRIKRNGYRYTKRDVGMVRWAIMRLYREALKDVDPELQHHMLLQKRDYDIQMVRTRVVKDETVHVVPLGDMWQMVQVVIDRECKWCLKTEGECKSCGLRKMLRKYVPEPEGESGCGYKFAILSDEGKRSGQKRL